MIDAAVSLDGCGIARATFPAIFKALSGTPAAIVGVPQDDLPPVPTTAPLRQRGLAVGMTTLRAGEDRLAIPWMMLMSGEWPHATAGAIRSGLRFGAAKPVILPRSAQSWW